VTKQVEPRNRRNSSIYIPSSRLHLHFVFILYQTHHLDLELSRQHVTCTKQQSSFQNTPNDLHNFGLSLWVSFCYIHLYHNANTSGVDSFPTRSDGTKGQPQRKRDGNCYGKNADIGYKSMPVVGSGLSQRIHLGTHLWTHTDIQYLRRQGSEGMESLF